MVIIHYDCGAHYDRDAKYYCQLYACIFVNVCIKFTNLTHFQLDMNDKCFTPCRSLNLSSITGHSFKIVYLNIKVNTTDDCLFLLNDHLSQLRTFIIHVTAIDRTSMMIQNTVRYLTKQYYELGQN